MNGSNYPIGFMKKVFICSRYAGDIKRNKDIARQLCSQATSKTYAPLAPHLLYPQFLDDEDQDDRIIGQFAGLAFLEKCDEVWVYAEDGISDGMKSEIELASKLGIPVKFVKLEATL